MNVLDRTSTGAREISWFHQLLDGKRARPPKSSDSLTVLREGGAGGWGSGVGAGVGDGVDSVGGVGVDASLVVLGMDDGAIDVTVGSLPQPEIRAQTTTDRAAAARIRPILDRDNLAN